MEISSLANTYFDKKQPWKSSGQRLETTMALCLEAVKILAIVSFPLIPTSAEKVWKMLGCATSLEVENWDRVLKTPFKAGHQLQKSHPLFVKIEDTVIAEEKQKLYGQKPDRVYQALKPEISIEDFGKIDLRVGKILAAEKIAKSKKLLHLTIDLGFEKRSIVSGIGEHYKEPSELIGKQVTVVANLEPATLMGQLSQGMVLAASEGTELRVVAIDDIITPGVRIT
jgi:methionyl-tRNA synthetase